MNRRFFLLTPAVVVAAGESGAVMVPRDEMAARIREALRKVNQAAEESFTVEEVK